MPELKNENNNQSGKDVSEAGYYDSNLKKIIDFSLGFFVPIMVAAWFSEYIILFYVLVFISAIVFFKSGRKYLFFGLLIYFLVPFLLMGACIMGVSL